MKAKIYSTFLQICIPIFFSFGHLVAQNVKAEKKFSKTLSAAGLSALTIENKYGEVHINTGNVQEIKVDVTMTARASNQEKADRILNDISISFTEGKDPKFTTVFNTHSSLKGSFSSLKGNIEFEVKYRVEMPKSLTLNLSNKFGDVYLANHDAALNLTVAYGSMKLDQMSGNTPKNIKLSFGNGIIDYLSGGDLTVAYSNLKLEKTQKISLKNSFSTTEIQQIDVLALENKYSNLKIESLGSADGSSAYSKFEVNTLKNALRMSTKYDSGFAIKNISQNFKEITLDNQFASVELDFNDQVSFDFEVDVKYGNLKLDKSKASLQKEIIQNNASYYEGRFGTKSSSGNKVKITSKYGNIHLK